MSALTGRIGSGPFTFQSAQTTNANGNALELDKWNSLAIQVTSSAAFNGTVTFEGSVDGTNYASVVCYRTADLNPSATTSGVNLNEIWWCQLATNLVYFRCRTSSTTLGNVTAVGIAKP